MGNDTADTTKWIEVLTPSGENVKIRRMRLGDEDILTDTALGRTGGTMTALLAACTDKSEEDVEAMLVGDRTFLLIEIRRLRSNEYAPRVKCPNCEAWAEQILDLSKLRLQKLDRTKVGTGNTFVVHLPYADVDVTCGLLTGREERQYTKLATENPKLKSTYAAMIQVKSIEGVTHKTLDWFRKLDAEDVAVIRAAFEAHDCGYDKEVDMRCETCGHEWNTNLPFDASFFLGRKTKKPEASSSLS